MSRSTILNFVYKAAIALLLLALSSYVVQWFFLRLSTEPFTKSFISDFRAFWSPLQILLNGANPYDKTLLANVQQTIPKGYSDIFLMFWNPPWLLPLLLPLAVPFEISSRIWFATNLAMLFVGLFSLWKIVNPDTRPSAVYLLCGLVFFPTLNLLDYGQLGLLVFFGYVQFLRAICKKRDFVAGLCLALAAVKPHTGFLFWIVIFWWCIVSRRLKVALGFICSIGSLSLVAIAFYPAVFTAWLNSFAEEKPTVWLTSSLTSVVTNLLGDTLGTTFGQGKIFLLLFPLLAIVLTAIWLLKRKPVINWLYTLPPLLCLSLILAPYSWLHDFVMLLIPTMLSIALAYKYNDESRTLAAKTHLWGTITLYLILQFICILQSQRGFMLGHHFFWLSASILIFWFVTTHRYRQLSRKKDLAEDSVCRGREHRE